LPEFLKKKKRMWAGLLEISVVTAFRFQLQTEIGEENVWREKTKSSFLEGQIL
jgi:hypothetical protein